MDNVLAKVKGFYESSLRSSTYQNWVKESKEAWRFYDGEQWSQDEIDALAENGQPAIVINKIASKIDNVAGSEISGRTRILYRSRSGDKAEEQTATALSDLALYVSERSDQPIEISNMFKEGLVAGISWLDVGVENAVEGTSIFNRHEDSLDVVWDVNSKRMDYSDARFVCRQRWLDKASLSRLFPKHADKLVNSYGTQESVFSSKSEVEYFNDKQDLIRIVEVQYKQTEKRYVVTNLQGEKFVTFDKKHAFANSENEVESNFFPRVYVAYFSDNVLLENKPLSYDHGSFTLIPYIFKRNKADGRPYGILRSAIDPQRELNKRRSKAMHLLNTAQVIADIDAVEDPNILAREAARPDGIILKRPGKELRIIRNNELAASQVSVMEKASIDIQEVMGVFDESIGKHSNATSGTAIVQRQMAGSQNHMFAFDALRRSKKQLGIMLLSLIRQFFTAEMVIQVTDNLNAPRVVHLNEPMLNEYGEKIVDGQGNAVMKNNVREGLFDIHVEEVKDVMSSREFELAQLNGLMQAGVPVPPKMLVEASNVKNKEEILAGFEKMAPTE